MTEDADCSTQHISDHEKLMRRSEAIRLQAAKARSEFSRLLDIIENEFCIPRE